MSLTNPLSRAIAQLTVTGVAGACGVTHQAVRKWEAAGRFPASEHAGGTEYAKSIAAATGRRIGVNELREWSRRGWEKKAA